MNKVFIIAEIGQNHNGSVDVAKLIVDLIARPITEETFNLSLRQMDAVKMTRRDLNEELSATLKAAPYSNDNSFGKTYGEHRAYLELDDQAHYAVYLHAKSKGLQFVETICAPGALKILALFSPDYLKVASRDLANIPLLAAMAETKIPMIISTGMAGKKQLDNALDVITKYHSSVSIMHCVSEYPTKPSNVNLKTISYLIKNYSQYTIGYSDHTIGISAAIAAVALGAKIIEKHVTIDRRMKGTDQAGALGPEGVYRMVRDIRLTEMESGSEEIAICPDTMEAKKKLERSIATNKIIAKGQRISNEDIHLLSPGDGYPWSEKELVIGKTAVVDIEKDEIIYKGMVA
jgi:sialic acid synthase